MKSTFLLLVFSIVFYSTLDAQMSAKLIQFPDVSHDQIVFTYGNDLWLVNKSGGQASRLSSPIGRETNAKFSPDGKTIAFEANYDGNNDLYTMPVMGGVPQRVTSHGMNENIKDWYADGKHLLFTSSMESGKQRFSQFYKVNAAGGLPEKLPLAMGENASLSSDGSMITFTEKSRLSRTWKRYRGGTAADIYIMDLKTLDSENITNSDANDEMPMYHGTDIYYLSDRDTLKKFNIWKYNTLTKQHEQITKFTEYDIHYPSIGPNDMVFEAGGKLYILDLAKKTTKEVIVNAVGDFNAIKPMTKSVGGNIAYFNISPDGNRAVVESRGDVFSLPKENGITQNLTHTSGEFERYPAWSPDGRYIAYFSDRSGEYELTLKDLKTHTVKTVTKLGPGFRYNIYWSPDNTKVVFVDQTMNINLTEIATGKTEVIDHDIALFEGGLRGFKASWSSDSKY
ncbi:MAG: Tricorn protease like protein, partial [Saprospiraceae bacterium]